jgi:hypothetical protein
MAFGQSIWQSRRALVVLTLVALCGGCSIPRSNHARDAQTMLVGLPRADLYRCAGLPDHSTALGDVEFLTYNNDLLTSGGITIPIIGGGVNFFDSKYCHATFVLKDDKVGELHYSGNAASALAPLDQCGYIVEACVWHLRHEQEQQAKPADKP